jgi:hypothetical protein
MSEGSSATSLEIRPWAIVSAISGLGAVAVAGLGNWLYDRDPQFPGTRTALLMGVVLVLALVVFSYSVVPLLVRALIDAQAKLTSQERPLAQRVRQSEGTIRLAAWALWTLVLLVVVLGILLGGSHR